MEANISDRELWLVLAGWCYDHPEHVDRVFAEISQNAPPEDIANLLGAFRKKDRKAGESWFMARGCVIHKDERLPDALIGTLKVSWQRRLAETLVCSLAGSAIKSASELLDHAQEIAEILKRNGVAGTDKPGRYTEAGEPKKQESTKKAETKPKGA